MFLVCASNRTANRFREKYHPVIKKDRDTTVRQQLRTRVNAFVDLMDSGRLDKIGLDAENMDGIVRLLDAGVWLFWCSRLVVFFSSFFWYPDALTRRRLE